jgi:cardiolipin synthase
LEEHILYQQTVPGYSKAAYSHDNAVKLLHGGREYFDVLKLLINKARHTIHLQFYIFNDDETGKEISDALIKAAAKGVTIYLLIDGYESRFLPQTFIDKLLNAGIKFEQFEPLFRSKKFYIGRRLHHKVVVVDGIYALVGGINIADRYNDRDGEPAWTDMGILIQGSRAFELNNICNGLWKDATGVSINPITINNVYVPPIMPGMAPNCSICIRRNDWVKSLNQIWKSYFNIFNRASESIVIMCSYFLPGWIFLKQIKKAIARGVNVKVILTGISDVKLAKHAERHLYQWMLRNRVEIYEYKPTILHAKIAVSDNKWMTIGSYNVNNISAHASVELNIDVRNKSFVSGVEKELLQIANEKCIRITRENFYITQNLLRRFWQWFCYQAVKVILYLATFYFKQERNSVRV